LSQFYSDLKGEAQRLGWGWVLGYRVLKRLGIREVKFHPAGLSAPVYCRIEGSDIYEYKQSLGEWAEPLRLGFVPRTIVDVGANVGYASLRFAREFPQARIIAIEPAEQNRTQLQKNCSSYANISLEYCALWPDSGRVRIRDGNVGHNAYEIVEDREGNIPALSMADLLSMHDIDQIDLLKIDIEGSEKRVFDDPRAREWLTKVGMLLIETHDHIVPGCSESVLSAMRGLGEFKGHINEYEYYVLKQPAGISYS
jgi:FkbM family methyltransferase